MTPSTIIRDFGLTPASSSLRWLIAADAIEELGRGDVAASIRAELVNESDYNTTIANGEGNGFGSGSGRGAADGDGFGKGGNGFGSGDGYHEDDLEPGGDGSGDGGGRGSGQGGEISRPVFLFDDQIF